MTWKKGDPGIMKKLYAFAMSVLMACTVVSYPDTVFAASPSDASLKYSQVPVAEHVTPEMLQAQYWVGRIQNANAVILSQDQIQSFNIATRETLGSGVMYDLSSYGDTIAGSELKNLIESQASVPSGEWYVDGKMLEAAYWQGLQSQLNLGNIGSENPVRFGVTVHRTSVRSFPTKDVVTDEATDLAYDILQETALLCNEPVVVLHESANGLWYYAVSGYYRGWVPAADIALFQNKTQWEQARVHRDFLVVTGSRVRLEQTPYSDALSELELSMGTVMDLVKKEQIPSTVFERVPMNNYVIKLPTRQAYGMVKYEYALLPMNRDVSVGYLPYTRANVLTQSFKMLGDTYGWGGMLNARDCSSLTYEVYKCFGFQLPRNSGDQGNIPCLTYDFTGKTTAQRKQILDQLKPGSILNQPGHITLYLGKVDGRYYVINSTGGFAPEGTGATSTARIRSVVINDLTVRRANGVSWLDSLQKAKEIGTPA
ncbi:MAG: hypothetical protein E7569_09570 [Ruminococcaceae bacterium]|nr:hypothetical protein [Oscillospiraceae bacterium]